MPRQDRPTKPTKTLYQVAFDPDVMYDNLVVRGMSEPDAEALVREHIERANFGVQADKPSAIERIADLLLIGGHATSLGFSDELSGALSSVLPGGQTGAEARAQSRGAIKQARQRTPFLAEAAADLIGSTPTLMLGGTALGPALAGTSTGFKIGTIGALSGAARGVGEGETPAERVGGGVVGGTLGVAAGIAGGVGAKVLRKLAPNVMKVVNNTRRLLGKGGNPRLQEALLRERLTNMGVAPADVEAAVQRTMQRQAARAAKGTAARAAHGRATQAGASPAGAQQAARSAAAEAGEAERTAAFQAHMGMQADPAGLQRMSVEQLKFGILQAKAFPDNFPPGIADALRAELARRMASTAGGGLGTTIKP